MDVAGTRGCAPQKVTSYIFKMTGVSDDQNSATWKPSCLAASDVSVSRSISWPKMQIRAHLAEFALIKARVRLTQTAMSNRDASVAGFCSELRIKPLTLYRYVGPDGETRKHGNQVHGA